MDSPEAKVRKVLPSPRSAGPARAITTRVLRPSNRGAILSARLPLVTEGTPRPAELTRFVPPARATMRPPGITGPEEQDGNEKRNAEVPGRWQGGRRAVASWHGLSQGSPRGVTGAVGEIYAVWVSDSW